MKNVILIGTSGFVGTAIPFAQLMQDDSSVPMPFM